MKILKVIKAYKELIILICVVIYLIIRRYPTPLIIIGTISIGICLYLMKFFLDRMISKNEAQLEARMVKLENIQKNITNKASSEMSGNKFEEEIRILKKVIVYAESCSQFYNYKGVEAEKYIDERCKSFIDLVAPLLAVSPDIYQLVITTRHSLEPYVNLKIKEYIENRPALSDVEAEFHKVYKQLNLIQNNMSDFNMNNVTCAICMIDKYGFSKELLIVVKGINQEIYNAIFSVYDQRLRSIESYYDMSYECSKDPENAWKLR